MIPLLATHCCIQYAMVVIKKLMKIYKSIFHGNWYSKRRCRIYVQQRLCRTSYEI